MSKEKYVQCWTKLVETTSRARKSIGIRSILKQNHILTSVSGRGTFCEESVLFKWLMFSDIATVHIFMLVIMRHLVNELNHFFFFFLQFLVFIINTKHANNTICTGMLFIAKWEKLYSSELFISFNRTKYFLKIGYNISKTLQHVFFNVKT